MSSVSEKYGYCVTWEIDNFSFCPLQDIASSYFTLENLCEETWQMTLCPDILDGKDIIRIFLVKQPGTEDIIVNFKTEIIGPSGDILEVYEEKNAIFSDYSVEITEGSVEKSCIMQNLLKMGMDALKIRCHMSRAEIFEKSLNYVIRTKIIVNHQNRKSRWRRHNELKTLFESDMEKKYITTKYIIFPDMSEFELRFSKSEDNVEITIYQSFFKRQCVECQISLLDINGCKLLSVKDRYQFSKEGDLWILPPFFTISHLNVSQNKFIKDDCMFILCELFCNGGIESQSVFLRNRETKLLTNHSDNIIAKNSLQSDIRNLSSDKYFCDVKIQGTDGIVEAHKSILAARSRVFHTMFQQDMLETQTGIVNIPDADIALLKLLVNFLYSDTLEKVDYDRVKNLFILADKYEICRLREICASFLQSYMSERNVCEIASLANMVNHSDLKSFALDFIVDYHTDIFHQPDWIPWTKNNMELATEVFQKLTEQQINLKGFFVKI